MSAEENKAVIHRLTKEFWDEGNASVIDQVVAADFDDHSAAPGLAPGREGLKQMMLPFRAAFSQPHTTIDDAIVEGEKVVWRWTFQGTHTGLLMGIPATGKAITFTGITIDRVVGGTIVERWNQADFMGLMQQLGVIPAPQAP
jgi:predicted ester cyclase